MSKAIIAGLIVFVLCNLPKRKNIASKLDRLIQHLEQGNYEELFQFLPGGARANDPEFWAVSLGVRGLLRRIKIAWTYLRIVQTLCTGGFVCQCGTACVWRILACQLLFSILALPEAALSYFHKHQRRALQKAVQYYCDLLVEVNTLCVTPNSPECLSVLPELL